MSTQILAILHLDELAWAPAPMNEEVRGVAPCLGAVAKLNRDRLGGDGCPGIQKADQRDVIPLQCALMLDCPCPKRLETNDVGAAAERYTPQSTSNVDSHLVRNLRTKQCRFGYKEQNKRV